MEDRIETLKRFYREGHNGKKVCSFMSPEVTRFEIAREEDSYLNVGSSAVEWAKTKQPLALTYVFDTDFMEEELEKKAGVKLFGKLFRALKEDEGFTVDQNVLDGYLERVFGPSSDRHVYLSYREEPFLSIMMGPRHKARYAPISSFVMTRLSDLEKVSQEMVRKIRHSGNLAEGGHYDAKGLFIGPA